MVEREPTGVAGFDELVEGGLPKKNVILISGSPGTGKTAFALHFLHAGAAQYDQKGLYVSLEQKPEELFEQAEAFGIDLRKLEKQGKIRVIFMDITSKQTTTGQTHVDLIKHEALRFGAKRVVIDSLTPLADFPLSYDELVHYGMLGEIDKLLLPTVREDLVVRMQVHKTILALKSLKDCTSLILSETRGPELSRDGVSEFMADGVIILSKNPERSLRVEKMRLTRHAEKTLPLEITRHGLRVRSSTI